MAVELLNFKIYIYMYQELSPVVIVKGEYNPNLRTVEQYGFIDLRSSYRTGVVSAQLPDTMEYPNGIEDPASIIGRPDDVFATKRAIAVYDSIKAADAVHDSAPSDLSPGKGGDA